MVEEHAERKIDAFAGPTQLYSLTGTDDRIGVSSGFGVGAPATAVCVESLVARSTETVCIVGGCGGLGGSVVRREPIVADHAIRDEGVSHHYLPSAQYAHADEALVSRLKGTLDAAGLEPRVGPSWTMMRSCVRRFPKSSTTAGKAC